MSAAFAFVKSFLRNKLSSYTQNGVGIVILHSKWGTNFHPSLKMGKELSFFTENGVGIVTLHPKWGTNFHPSPKMGNELSSFTQNGEGMSFFT